jgi:hypothetical protein
MSCAENVADLLRITRKEPPALRKAFTATCLRFLSDPLIVIDFIVIYIIVNNSYVLVFGCIKFIELNFSLYI